ncbi:GntR family transcriptional regulator [Fodinicola acaciae]|uniref:GntR family transcriptional regulator n=1 Tax=Fodinicola acaciae TaxID=2681555 RepID=UPI0013D17932|nr:GntR family transcriptional regulator [Fodinicola acaciae]
MASVPVDRPAVRLPQRNVLSDDVYESVKALIMDHVVEPGARMSIDGLARDLQVSPTPLREALARLESDGLVVKQPLRGYRSTPLLTTEELTALYDFRLLIEPWAAAQAAARIDDAGSAALQEEMETGAHVPEGGDYETFKSLTLHDTRFHDLVARLSGNEPLRLALERTHCHLHTFRLYYSSGIGSQAVAEHRAVVKAIAGGRPEAAEKAMRRHLEKALRRLVVATTDGE